ncbi:MAG: BON domain-containing protein [Rhodothermales bacterium]
MQAKPLAITIIFFGVLAFAADAWLIDSTETGQAFERSQVAPMPSAQSLRSGAVDGSVSAEDVARKIVPADTLEMSLTVAQKLQDLTLVAQVEKKLFRNSELSAYKFKVSSANGEVTLAGSVTSEREKQRALRIAQSISGVRSVTNQIEVVQLEPAISESNSG